MKMSSASFLVLVSILLVNCSVAEQATEFAEASDGGSASLPCNLTPTHIPDKVSVVLWYKGDEENPLYKYDMRNNKLQHWVEPSLGSRFILRKLDDQRVILTISPTKMEDEEIYHCRVDFFSSPTRITHVNLTIVVPPNNVQVSDDFGIIKNGMTTAYAEGASLTLTCSASGGKPLAKVYNWHCLFWNTPVNTVLFQVTWWRDGEMISDDIQYYPDRKKSSNLLKIEKLTRQHLLVVYSCEVSNSRLQPPLVMRVAIDMYLRPLEVSLIGNNPDFSAGKRYNVTCRVKGSRPAPTITWWKDGVSLEGGIVTVSADGNTTTSTLIFTPQASDHGLILTCKASNQKIPFSEQQRTWMLRVLYPPRVSLTLGHGLDGNDIKEGADVYFECHLVANPWVHRVWWLRNGDRLFSNATAGIIVSNQTLVLQGVSRFSSGRYCCEATNKEGTARSPAFHLRVKFEPLCGDGGGRKVLGAAKNEPLKVECKVDSEPTSTMFRWSFNSTPGISRELSEFTAEAGSSILTYVPRTPADYGTLQCWGRNELGSQRIPCTYHIVPAGKPDPPHTCSVTNITHHSVLLNCKKGFDGGLRQKFMLILNSGDDIIANLSSTATNFSIKSLEPSQEYSATIYSFNSKGLAKNFNPISFRTLPAPGLKEQRRSTGPTELDKSTSSTLTSTGPWLYILLAAGSTLIIASTVGIIIFAVKRFRVDSPVRERRQQRSPKIEESPLDPRMPGPFTDTISDDNNPDLIPPANGAPFSFFSLNCNRIITENLLDVSLPPYTITARPSCKRNCATQMPVKPYHVTWAPILQSRNCSTQTPPPHKESSV